MDLSNRVLDVINILLSNKGKILEIGAGVSSSIFVEAGYEVWAIENNPEWMLGKKVNYIYAPLKEFNPPKSHEKRFPGNKVWYDMDIIKQAIAGHVFDLMVVDGPRHEIGRAGLFMYRDFFNWDIPVIFDDTQRRTEWELARHLAADGDRYLLTLDTRYKKQFTVMLSTREECIKLFKEGI